MISLLSKEITEDPPFFKFNGGIAWGWSFSEGFLS